MKALPMISKAALAICLVWTTSCSTLDSSRDAIDPNVAQLLGKRPLSLQWISWDDFGEAEITRGSDPSTLTITGAQRSTENDDYLTIDGTISNVTDLGFTFNGVIVTKVSHNNGGEAFRREGTYRFGRYGDRRFWRLVERTNPEGHVDYVDLYEDMAAAKAPPAY